MYNKFLVSLLFFKMIVKFFMDVCKRPITNKHCLAPLAHALQYGFFGNILLGLGVPPCIGWHYGVH